MSAARLLSRLDRVRKTGPAQWVACCPSHDSKSRQSLTIAETADGRVLLHDFGGCSALEVLEAIGLTFADLFPERAPDDAGRRVGWRTAGYRDSRQQHVHIAARTALVAVAHDATEAAVLVADVAENKVMVADVRMRLFDLAGRIASALEIAEAHRG